MTEKNQKLLVLLSAILEVSVSDLLDKMVTLYIDSLTSKELGILESELRIAELREINGWVSSQIEE